jgi:hypothetical protein
MARRHWQLSRLVLALVAIGLVSVWEPTGAAWATSNVAPTLTAANLVLDVPEGTTARVEGSFNDPEDDAVQLSASIGQVDVIGQNSPGVGLWAWTLPVLDGPDALETTITADDGQGETTSLVITVNVLNIPPTAETRGPDFVPVGSDERTFKYSVHDFYLDTVTTAVSCGAGTLVSTRASDATSGEVTCRFPAGGSTKVGVTASDDDGASIDGQKVVVATANVDTFGDAPYVVTDGAGDGFGGSLAVTDLNGDGQPDLIIGNDGRTVPPAQGGSGVVAVFLGPLNAPTMDLTDATPPDGFRIDRADPNDGFGTALAAAGDVNGDGIDDVVIGASLASPHGRSGAGSAYVVYGSTTPADVDLAALDPAQGFRIDGGAVDVGFGRAVGGGGDVNGDGYDDVVVGAPATGTGDEVAEGEAVVIFGGPTRGMLDTDALGSDGFRIAGLGIGSQAGTAVAIGKLDRDPYADVVVGAPAFSDGAVLIAYGGPNPVDIDPATSPAGDWAVLRGEGAGRMNYNLGSSVAVADVTGDGRLEIVAGDPGARNGPGVPPAGSVVVFLGRDDRSTNVETSFPAGSAVRVFGIFLANIGATVATGDFDGDGKADIASGGWYAFDNGSHAGGAYRISLAGTPADLSLTALSPEWRRIDGDGPDREAGHGLAAGDMTGDGLADLIMSDREGISGRVAVFSGTARPELVPPTTSAPGSGAAVGAVGGSVPIKLTWTGSDAGSGIGWYELQVSRNGGPYVAMTLGSPTAKALTTSLRLGTYRFRVRAVDGVLNVGSWKYGPTTKVASVSDGSSSIRYGGRWRRTSSSVYWGGAAHTGLASGATATLRFSGRSVGLVSRVGPTRGRATIYVDGRRVATIDCYAPVAAGPKVVWTHLWSKVGSHTVTIKLLGTHARPKVDVDGFVIAR